MAVSTDTVIGDIITLMTQMNADSIKIALSSVLQQQQRSFSDTASGELTKLFWTGEYFKFYHGMLLKPVNFLERMAGSVAMSLLTIGSAKAPMVDIIHTYSSLSAPLRNLSSSRLDPAAEGALKVLLTTLDTLQIPKNAAEALANDAQLVSAMKAAVTRYAVKSAVMNGAWRPAATAAVFDIRLLFDGHFLQYLTRIGIKAGTGGAVGGLGAVIDHPFFGNGLVLGVLLSTTFNICGLASSGDWNRFGKDFGMSVGGALGSWGGSTGGAAVGTLICPGTGTAVGGFLGGMLGGFGASQLSSAVPGLKGMTSNEIMSAFKVLEAELEKSGLSIPPETCQRQFVETYMKFAAGDKAIQLPVVVNQAMIATVEGLRQVVLDLARSTPGGLEALRAALVSAKQQ